jgi:peptidoglycan-associated lipoprotein
VLLVATGVATTAVTTGLAESQLEAVSYGKEKPSAEGTDELSLAKNRRVEIRY